MPSPPGALAAPLLAVPPLAAETGVLLFAHGASDGQGGAIAEAIAGRLRARGVFAEVAVSFALRAPQPAQALAGMTAGLVVVAPLLASAGGIATDVLPRLLGEAGIRPERLMTLAPIGLDPGMADLAVDAAWRALEPAGVAPGEAALLIAAHGARRRPASRTSAETLAGLVAAGGRFAEVATVFLEQAPFVAQWRTVTLHPNVVVVPLFTSGGHHEERDLPHALAGPDSGQPLADQPLAGQPLDGRPREGRRLWLTPALGHHPGLADLMARRVFDLLQRAAYPLV